MLIRVLSEWSGSPRCGVVADVPDALAHDRVRSGFAEPVSQPRVEPAVSRVVVPEVAVLASAEQAIAVAPKKRGRK